MSADVKAISALLAAYYGLILRLDISTRAGCKAWARSALQARREALKMGFSRIAENMRADAVHAWQSARRLSNPKPFDAGRFRVVMEREGATSAAIERCLDLARRETCAELTSFRGQRGAA